jgi:hypothetical protein
MHRSSGLSAEHVGLIVVALESLELIKNATVFGLEAANLRLHLVDALTGTDLGVYERL